MSRTRPILLALALAVVAVFGGSSPALAHDELLASTPSNGERLASAPSEVSLTFSAEVLTMGAAVIVADASGRDWVVGDPIVDAGQVTVEVDASMPDAGYEVRWRVVSSDGHPISGLIPFTIGDGEPLTRDPVAAAPDETAPEEQPQSTQENQGALRVALVGVGGATVAVVVFALIHFLRRRIASRSGGTGDQVD